MLRRFEIATLFLVLVLSSLAFAAGWAPYGPGNGLGMAPELGYVPDQATLVRKHVANSGRSRLYDDLKIALNDPKVGEAFRRASQVSGIPVETLVDGFSVVMDKCITEGKMRERVHALGERVLVVMGSDRAHYRRYWTYYPSEIGRAKVWTAYVYGRGVILDWGIVEECGNLEIFRVRYVPPTPTPTPTPISTPTPPPALPGGSMTPGVSVAPELAGRKAGGYDYTITQTPVVPAPVLIPETRFPAPVVMRNGQKATITVGSSTVQLDLANTVTGSGAVAITGGGGSSSAAGAVDVAGAGAVSGVVTTPPISVEYFPGGQPGQ